MAEEKRNMRKSKVGVVVSDKMKKTRIVGVERRVRHPLYGKYLTRTTKLVVHDPEEQSKIGDVVKVVETRPLSKTKRWRLLEIIKRVGAVEEVV